MQLTTAAAVAAVLAVLPACGDNLEPTPDASMRCDPPPPPLPTPGALADPLALELPAACVVGGLRDLPGRWFVSDPAELFTFEYPKFEGSCDGGFRRANWFPEDRVLDDDNATFETWSDGTRFFNRRYVRFEFRGQIFEFATAFAACLLPDGSLAARYANFNSDQGERSFAMTGTRFAPKGEPASGLALVGELGTWGEGRRISGYNVVVEGDHAYVAGAFGLEVIDVSDPARPVHVGHVEGDFNDVRVVRGGGTTVAYAAPIRGERTTVIDVSTPTAPVAVGQLPYSHSVQVATRGESTFLYLADYTEFVPVYDVTAPRAPVRVGAARVPGEVAGIHDLTVDGDRIYANNTTAGLVAFDVGAGLDAVVPLGQVPTTYSHASWVGTAGGRTVVLHGDEGMTPEGGAFLRVLDGDPGSPTYLDELSRFATRPEVGIHNILMVGDKAYIAYYQDGVRIVDLSTPTAPREVAHHDTWDFENAPGTSFEGAVGIRVVGDLVYVADSQRGLLIFRED